MVALGADEGNCGVGRTSGQDQGTEDVEDDRGHEDRGPMANQGAAQNPGAGREFGAVDRYHRHVHRQQHREHD